MVFEPRTLIFRGRQRVAAVENKNERWEPLGPAPRVSSRMTWPPRSCLQYRSCFTSLDIDRATIKLNNLPEFFPDVTPAVESLLWMDGEHPS